MAHRRVFGAAFLLLLAAASLAAYGPGSGVGRGVVGAGAAAFAWLAPLWNLCVII